MYTVKRFNKGETLRSLNTGQRELGWTATTSCYAIINPDGQVNLKANRLTGKKSPEIYGLKSVAQQQADWYNEQAN